jgi:flagellar motor protein MotB
MTDIIINSGNNNIGNNNGNNGNNIDYFKLGSLTRRHSIIGCIGFEFANPSPQLFEEEDKEEEEEYKQKEQKEEQKEEYKQKEDKEYEQKEQKEEQKEEDKEQNSCAICLEQQAREQTKNLATTPCGHTFCLTCLLSHLKHNNTCPLCRAPIEENSKKPAAHITYDEGVMLLNYELSSLRIEEEIEQFVQNAIEIAGNSQTDGSNVSSVVDDLLTMVASFGFNLLYDAVCHMHHGEENVDPEWQYEMYGSSEDGSDEGSDEGSSESGDDDDDDESEGNLTTISSSSSSSSSSDDDDKVWGKMYQLPDID